MGDVDGGRSTKAKGLEVIEGHRTKAELETRRAWQQRLKNMDPMRITPGLKNNKAARIYYNRLKKVFAACDMDEAFYETTLSRYCVMLAEHEQQVAERERINRQIDRLELQAEEMDPKDYFNAMNAANAALDQKDKTIAKLRDQLLAIEKDNIMTVQGKLRAVPKKPQDDGSEDSGLAAIRARRMQRNA